MKAILWGAAAASAALVLGCGGSGGGSSGPDAGLSLSPTERVIDLSPAELMSLCEFISDHTAPRTAQCDGHDIETWQITVAQCLAGAPTNPNCPLTVQETEDCVWAREVSDLCAGDPPECTLFNEHSIGCT